MHIGIHGTVLALDRATGLEIWRTPLKGDDFVNLVLDDGVLYAATKGEMFALDAENGRVLWNNPLKGLGWGLVSIASRDQSTVLLRQKKRRDEQAAATTGAAGV